MTSTAARNVFRLLSLLVVTSLVACADPSGVGSDILSARVDRPDLELANFSSRPVYYFAVERNSLATINWAICTDPDVCQSVPPRSAKTIPLEDVGFYDEGETEIVVFHWRLIPGQSATGFVADSVRALQVTVQ